MRGSVPSVAFTVSDVARGVHDKLVRRTRTCSAT